MEDTPGPRGDAAGRSRHAERLAIYEKLKALQKNILGGLWEHKNAVKADEAREW